MRFYVEIDSHLLSSMDAVCVESCQYGLTGEDVADLRDYMEALGYDWNEIAFVYEQRAA